MRLREWENQASARLQTAGADSPRLCAQLLLGHVLQLDRLGCVLEAQRALSPDELAALAALEARRAAGEPLAHILGRREFYGRDFRVSPATLIPRPETELLVDCALELLPAAAPLFFADLGTGSGCIGISLACERPHWHGLALELDAAAVAVAQGNTHSLNVSQQLACIRGDLAAVPLAAASCGLVVSNPPYIAEAERAQVMPEVLRYEPHTALFAPQQGLALLQAATKEAWRLLRPGGVLLLEHGAAQGAAVQNILHAQGFAGVDTRPDLAGLDRCTLGYKP